MPSASLAEPRYSSTCSAAPAFIPQLRCNRAPRHFEVIELRGDIAPQLPRPPSRVRCCGRALRRARRGSWAARRARSSTRTTTLALDAANSPGGGAEQEDVARLALDRKVLIDRADERALRLFDHAEVAGFGDHAAVEQRGQPRRAARTQHAVDPVAVDEGTRSARRLRPRRWPACRASPRTSRAADRETALRG